MNICRKVYICGCFLFVGTDNLHSWEKKIIHNNKTMTIFYAATGHSNITVMGKQLKKARTKHFYKTNLH